jgi:hypothetical protein
MKLHFIICLSFILTAHCGLLEENFFFHILENVVVPDLTSLSYLAKIRFAATLTSSVYEAISPYSTNSVGIYSPIPRRPVEERTTRNKNIAIGYASRHVISNLLSKSAKSKLNAILTSVGLNPEDDCLDLNLPIGIGNQAAKVVLENRVNDGMNQLGDCNGKIYNRKPYEDYTLFIPKNTAYELKYPTKWQPLIEESEIKDLFVVQSHTLPQYGFALPISMINISDYTLPEPIISDMNFYKQHVDEILKESSGLNDYKKMVAEHFTDKIVSLFQPMMFLAEKHGLGQDEVIILDFLIHMALFDAGIVVWKEKIIHESVRPISAIRYLYENEGFEAWGGPGVGIVKNITGKEWKSYVQTHGDGEYPSAIACFCAAQFAVLEKYLNTTEFGYSVVKPAGSSFIEPKITPKMNVTLGPYKTFDDYVDECAISRVWGGVHFKNSVDEGKKLCKRIGIDVYNFAIEFIGKK